MKIIEEKFSLIFKYMGIPKKQIRMEASFANDFDFEEFQFNCLVFYIGSYFKINIRERDYDQLNTIGNAMDFVRKKLTRRDRLKISRRKICPAQTLRSIPRVFPNEANVLCFNIFPSELCFVPELQYES